jgi:Na+/H+ antiporter NhaD/arsenite permease-like protein
MEEEFPEIEFEGSEVVVKPSHIAIYIAINIIVGIGLYQMLHNTQQTIATTIFIALVIGTLMFWRLRVAIAFIGIVVLLFTGTIDLTSTIEFMNLDVIVFLIGMMVIVALLKRSGFFCWLLVKAIKATKFRVHLLFAVILAMAAVMAALVDEVTSILFMCALMLDFCDYYKVKPVNYIISVVLATNIGSSWTVLGNPIGIMIAFGSGLTFEDFIRTAMPVGILSLICLILILLIWQRKELNKLHKKIEATPIKSQLVFLNEWSKARVNGLFRGSVIIFALVIIGLAFHYRLELALGLEPNTLLVAISIGGAGVVMLWQKSTAKEILTKEVDWWTLVFFMFLFAKAGCLKYVGVTDIISNNLMSIGGGNLLLLIPLILLFSGLISSVLDNVLVVAMFIPVIQSMTTSLGTNALWWALLFGACYGGNITMVGSTANIVALGILEDRKHYHMRFKYWIKIGLLGGLIPMAVALIATLLMFH